MRTLVLGGSRSGKSGYAEALLSHELAVVYVATGRADPADAEWTARIAAHRARRPASWSTVETGDLAAELVGDGPALLADSVTTWLARAMDDCGAWTDGPAGRLAERVDELVAAWSGARRRAVLVSDEVGLSVVPESASGRLFRDVLGGLNQRLAAAADEVVLVVAGLPLRLR
ncbi:MAG TPA: bifunctional adenosylcobinamide kinase/adenosylcobinamide-phosphate guanylyltransferase [Jatrophihabitans sp.]|nr:bifunctional adenosylcobinamide kinase/adenosylcobinamide-phosphate guanylyltransferase [Jatrophihabitans sp.]